MRSLLLLAALLLAPALAVPARADNKPQPPHKGDAEIIAPLPRVRLLSDGAAAAAQAAAPEPPTANGPMKNLLDSIGWKAIDHEALVRKTGADKGYIPGNYLKEADIEWKDGKLIFSGADGIDPKLLPMILEGLWIFVKAGTPPPLEVGKALAGMGLPPVIDGRKLVNPDGTATYYGQMLRLIFAEKPDAAKTTSVERLSPALDLLLHARDQAFSKQSADVAKTDFDRAKAILYTPGGPGETPFAAKEYKPLPEVLEKLKGDISADVAAAESAGDADRAKESARALAVLNTLQRQKYHPKAALPAVPKPGQALPEDTEAEGPEPSEPLASGLPVVLRVLTRLNGGKPLTSDQQENLIKSFPMGDLVWRLGAQDLWQEGLTGKGVKVAVIDGGIGHHSELEDAVKKRVNMTADRGKATVDDHGTHVAGIIHALAPDAELRGYTVFAGDAGNPVLKESSDPLIIKAIRRAVDEDHNQIISLSLGGDGSPSDTLAREIEKYAGRGVVFVVAAGNEHDKNGVESPAVAPNSLSVGALDGAGNAADFSSYGSNYDARKLKHVVKAIFMLPGTNIYSTVMDDGDSAYALMDGTSMATPALSGVTALLTQAARTYTANPVELSARVRDALADGSRPMVWGTYPRNAPIDQPFLVVKPLDALTALRQKAAPAVGKK